MKKIIPLIFSTFYIINANAQAVGGWGTCEFTTVAAMNSFDPSTNAYDCKKVYVQATDEHYHWDGTQWVLDGGTDDQTASEVSFSAAGTISSTNVQDAIEEIEPDIYGSIDVHSDVDITTTTPTAGDLLAWNGSNFVPSSTNNGFTIFSVWAEESSALGANQYEWAFGNGDNTPNGDGIVIPVDCELFAMSLNHEGGANTVVQAIKNTDATLTAYQVQNTGTENGHITFGTPLTFVAGDVINFRTISSSSGGASGRVSAWFRIRATPASTSLVNDLLDVSAGATTAGQILQFDGSSFVNVDLSAANTSYDNSTSGLTATNVQAAIDELSSSSTDDQVLSLLTNILTLEDGGSVNLTPYLDNTDDQEADEVPYDNTSSGLTATNVQAAIDEINASTDDNIYNTNGTLDGNRAVTQNNFDLNFDANTLVIDGSANNVGVGTNNPSSAKLQVNASSTSGGLHIDTDQDSPETITIRRTDNANEIGIAFQNSGNAHGSAILHRDQNDTDGLGEGLTIASIGNEANAVDLGATATFKNDGTIRLHDYGLGNNNDNAPANILGVQADGDVVEVAISNINTDDQTASEVNITDTGNNFSSTNVEGALAELAATSGDNIYTTNGTLTGNRAVTQGNFDLNFDANTMVIDGSANEVGIGTTSPDAKLDVEGGNVRFSDYGAGTVTSGTRTQYLAVDGDGDIIEISPATVEDNIYNANGTLTGNRTVTMGSFDVNFDANTFFIDGSTDEVGIGTNSPDAKLDVEGGFVRFSDYGLGNSTGTVTQYLGVDNQGDVIEINPATVLANIYTSDGSVGADRTVTMSNNDITFNANNGDFSVTHNGTSVLMVDNSAEEVGIGTTTPDAKLDVEGGNVRFSDYGAGLITSGTRTQYLAVDGDGDIIEVSPSILEDNIYSTNGTLTGNRAVTLGNFDLNFDANSLFIDGSTDEIGIGTTSPDAKLDVEGGNVRFSDYGAGTVTSGTRTQYLAVDGDGDIIEISPATVEDNVYNANGTLTGNRAVTMGNFDVNFDANTFFIDGSADEVGIGTNSPDAKLDVEGGFVRFSDYGLGNSTGSVTQYLGVDAQGDVIEINPATVTNNIYTANGSVAGNRTVTMADNDVTFDANNGDFSVTHNGTSVLMVDNSTEEVGIGTTTPDAKLDVEGGNVRFSDYGAGLIISGTRTQYLAVDGDGDIIEVSPATLEDNIYNANGTLTGNRAVTQGNFDLNFDANTLVIDGSDNEVGIGTTSPDAKLDVEGGNVRFSDYGAGTVTSGTRTQYLAVDGDGDIIEISPATVEDNIYNIDGTLTGNRDVTLGNFDVNFDANTFFIDGSTDEVGIGTNSPDAKLDVEGGFVRFSDYGLGNSTGTVTQYLGVDNQGDVIEINPATVLANIYTSDGSVGADRTVTMSNNDVTFNANNGDFSVTHNGTSVLMVDNSAEEVGIGTTTPDAKLDVEGGNVRFSDYGAGLITSGTRTQYLAVDGDGDIIEVSPATLEDNIYSANGTLTGNRAVTQGNFDLNFDANTLVIDGSANEVGIGTTSPDAKLDVEGGNVRFSDYGAGTVTSGARTQYLAVDNDGDVIEVSPATVEDNIYNADGTLTADRTVSMNNNVIDFLMPNGTSGEVDVFTIEDQDAGGGGQDHSSVLKVLKSGDISNGDNGFSLIEMTYTGADPNDDKYWIAGRKTDEGAPEWGVNISDNQIWSSGGLLLNASGAANGTYSGGNFIVEPDGDVGIGNNSPNSELDVTGRTTTTNFTMTNGASNGYILQSNGSGDATWVDPTAFTNTDDQTASEVNIADAGNNFTATNVEGALAELAAIAGDNIYNINGTLTNNRIVTQNNFDLNFDANTLVIDGSANNVGVGTNNPSSAKLQVNASSTSGGLHIDTDQDSPETITIRRTDNANEIGIAFQNSGNAHGSAIFHRDQNDTDGLGEGLTIASIGNENNAVDLGATATFKTDGTIRLHDYGLGNNNDNAPANILGVQADGDVVEVAISNINTDDQTASEVNITDAGNNFSSTNVEGALAELAAATDQNIYNTNGTLSGNRTVTMGTNDLTFDSGSGSNFLIDGFSSSSFSNPIFQLDRNAGRDLRFYHSDDSNNGYWTIGTNDAIALELDNVTGNGIYLESSGEVGIGTNTPAARLDVDGGTVRFSDYGAGTVTSGTRAQYLAVDSDGDVIEVSPAMVEDNIYNADGTLTADRTVSMNSNVIDFLMPNGTTGEVDVFTIEDQDIGGGGQDHSSVLKVLKNADIDTGDDGFSLIEMTYTGTDPDDDKYWIAGRKTDEGAPEWGVNISDNEIWSSGGLLLNASGAANGTYSGGNFIVEPDGDVGIGNNSPNSELDVTGRTTTTNFTMTNGANNGYILQSNGSGDATWVNPTTFTNTDDQTASEVNITDAGNNFTATNVEDALAELATNSGDNIYNTNGTLTGNRNVTQNNFDLNFDANTLVIDGSTDRVGIGTNAPAEELEVDGDTEITQHLYVGPNAGTGTTTTTRIREDFSTNASTYQLYSIPTITSPTLTGDRTSYGAYFRVLNNKTENTASGADSDAIGGEFRSYISGTNTFRSMFGVRGYAYNQSTASSDLGALYGGYFSAYNNANTGLIPNAYGSYNYTRTVNGLDGDITNAYGSYNRVRIDSDDGGDITTGRAGYFLTDRRGGANLMTTAYGIQVDANDGTTTFGIRVDTDDTDPSTNYGLYIDAAGATANNYGIFGERGDWVLDQDGNGTAGGTGSGGDLILGESQDFELYHDGSNSYIINNTGDLYISDAGTDDVIISNNGGNVGIGTTTPDAKLDVENGSVRFSDYGTGTYENTSTGTQYLLGVEADGDVVEMNTAKSSRIFYPPAISIPATAIANGQTINLHTLYQSLYNSPAVRSTGAPTAIPSYAADELYYYITDYDTSVLTITNLDASGLLTYNVDQVPTDNCAYINIIFVIKEP